MRHANKKNGKTKQKGKSMLVHIIADCGQGDLAFKRRYLSIALTK
jgi:hypothetical protein